jgi:hypothetical protein
MENEFSVRKKKVYRMTTDQNGQSQFTWARGDLRLHQIKRKVMDYRRLPENCYPNKLLF